MSAHASSWVVYPADHPFPIQNLPYGAFSTPNGAHLCVIIGDHALDLHVLAESGFFDGSVTEAFKLPTLNQFMGLGITAWKATRATLQRLLSADTPTLRDNAALKAKCLLPSSGLNFVLAVAIGDYTDFYASKEHATNLGKLFRPGQPALLENWLHLPVGYHGRASSIVVSGTPVRRPKGQSRPNPAEPPVYGPCKGMDFELEMAAYIGTGNAQGEPITVDQAPNHIFGFSLFNDWTARDIQKWEYVPLGPFLGKNFASTISPFIVTALALEPFLVAGPEQSEPVPLPYLQQKFKGNYDVNLGVQLTLGDKNETLTIAKTNFKQMYWSVYQQLAHHTVNGCNMRPGDVIASGTISGTEPGTYGSIIELTSAGANAITFPSGAQRKFLQDDDVLTLTGECVGEGFRIGFGPCSGRILPALP